MPTGYTSPILDKDASFEEFALRTAEAFSHLAQSLHEKGDLHAPLPDPAKLRSTYRQERIAEAEKALKNTLKMSFARTAKKAQQEFDRERKCLTGLLEKISIDRYRLDQMVKKVLAYEPPDTEAHKAHKKFMLDQLKATIEHDTNSQYYIEELGKLKLLSPQEWKEKALKQARHDLEYNAAEAAKEITRQKTEVDFLAKLRTAVKPPQPQ